MLKYALFSGACLSLLLVRRRLWNVKWTQRRFKSIPHGARPSVYGRLELWFWPMGIYKPSSATSNGNGLAGGPSQSSSAKVEGMPEHTILWDITDSGRPR